MDVLLLEAYDTGSHHAWMTGYQQHSAHHVQILSLPGQFWKWRMQGGAVTLARLYLAGEFTPDVILASDMLDLTTFLALTRRQTAEIPAAIYFHENQLSYPLGPRQRKELHFQLGFINYASAIGADAIYFNSPFHRRSFFDELPRLLKHFPDYNELESIEALHDKAEVLLLGLDLLRYDVYRTSAIRSGPPLVLWNHRWEFDKNPLPFLNALVRLADEGVPFRVALIGENFRQRPEEFERARARLGDRVTQYGYLESFADYARLLWQADVQVSTAHHDFFGASTCEAIYCGCVPLLPDRLNYPYLLPPAHHKQYLYHEGEIYYRLRDYLKNPHPAPSTLRAHVSQFDWRQQAPAYDAALEALAAGSNTKRRV